MPEWGSDQDRQSFEQYIAGKANTSDWHGASPLVQVDNMPAMGASGLAVLAAPLLPGEKFGTANADFWQNVANPPEKLEAADVIWQPAYDAKSLDFLSADPCGPAMHAQER